MRLEERLAASGSLGALDPHLLVGTWINTNAGGAGIRRLVLSADGSTMKLQVAARVNATPEDWGGTAAIPFADAVGSAEAVSFYAEYRFQGLGIRLQGYVVKGVLVIVSFVYSASPGETPGYMAKEFFYRDGRDCV
jgi:hypothetical protein